MIEARNRHLLKETNDLLYVLIGLCVCGGYESLGRSIPLNSFKMGPPSLHRSAGGALCEELDEARPYRHPRKSELSRFRKLHRIWKIKNMVPFCRNAKLLVLPTTCLATTSSSECASDRTRKSLSRLGKLISVGRRIAGYPGSCPQVAQKLLWEPTNLVDVGHVFAEIE